VKRGKDRLQEGKGNFLTNWMNRTVSIIVVFLTTIVNPFSPSRRAFVSSCSILLFPNPSVANSLSTAYYSAGYARFWQSGFDELKYAGVKSTVVGNLNDCGTLYIQALKVTYDHIRISYKRVVRSYWRLVNPTASKPFGEGLGTIIWTTGEVEEKDAIGSRHLLQLATEYKSATFGPMCEGENCY